jgi:hypothetical protein
MIAVFALLVLALLAFAGAFIYYSWKAKEERREAIATFALSHGMTYLAEDTGELARFDFRLFERGDGRGWENVVAGDWHGLPVRACDYWYYDQHTDNKGGTSRSYKRFTVAVAEVAAWLPPVELSRESVLTRLADHVGLRDIEFESEEFNRCWNVKAPDREFAFKLVDARMIAWLQDSCDGLCFEVNGPHVLVYTGQLAAADWPVVLSGVKGFVDHVPRLVWNEYGRATS